MQLTQIVKIKGKILCETGLHIGSSTEEIEIGGVEPIIKHPLTREPYIPGSSLKGKMRSQLEKREGIQDNGEPCGCGTCMICRVFGAHSTKHELGPTRILVRDALLSLESKMEFERAIAEQGRPYIERKVENVVNRKTGTAGHPRVLERVPAGTEFDFEIAIQILDIDSDVKDEIVNLVLQGLRLVQDSYLGGFGSRGSGKVKFAELTLDGKEFALE